MLYLNSRYHEEGKIFSGTTLIHKGLCTRDTEKVLYLKKVILTETAELRSWHLARFQRPTHVSMHLCQQVGNRPIST